MKGFGSNDRKIKKLGEIKISTAQKDKLISNAFSFHSSGKLKQAAEIYNYLNKDILSKINFVYLSSNSRFIK